MIKKVLIALVFSFGYAAELVQTGNIQKENKSGIQINKIDKETIKQETTKHPNHI